MKIQIRFNIIISIFLCSTACLSEDGLNRDSKNITLGKNYLNAGFSNCESREWGMAITNFSRYTLLNPTDANGYNYLAGALLAEGNTSAAESNYCIGVSISPRDVSIIMNRGNLYRLMGNYTNAMEDFTRCIQYEKTNGDAYSGRAATYAALGRYEKAAEDYSLSLEFQPGNSLVLLQRANMYVRACQYQRAIADYKNAKAANVSNADAYNDLAWLFATCPSSQGRNGSEALDNARSACELSKWQKWEYIDTLSAAYAECGDFQKAVETEAVALKLINHNEIAKKVIEDHLSLFRRGLPFREQSSTANRADN